MKAQRTIVLALESAIAGGSISILNNEAELAHWTGASEVSRAEDLLRSIDTILNENDLRREDIGRIAVSAGPGSFTGIRIGMATGLGLKAGLDIPLTSVSALDAMLATAEHDNAMVAIPMGRNSVCLQRGSGGTPFTVSDDQFTQQIQHSGEVQYIVHEKLYTPETALGHVTNFGSKVAGAIGRFALRNPRQNSEPLFISKAAQ